MTMRSALTNLKFLATVVVCGFGILLFGWIFWRFSSGVKNADLEIHKTFAKIQAREEEGRTVRNLSKLFLDRPADIDRVYAVFVDRETPVAFIEALERAARESKTALALDVDTGQSQGRDLFFRATLEGTPSSLERYVELLGLLPYSILVEDFSLEKIVESAPAVASPANKKNTPPPPPISHRIVLSLRVRTR